MQTASEYLTKTESAVRHEFDGVARYMRLLEPLRAAVFVSGAVPGTPEFDQAFAAWYSANADKIAAARRAEADFLAEQFALATLAGSILNIAEKALELYSGSSTIPPEFEAAMPSKPAARLKKARFCVGRRVRGVPLGLVIHAGRNQHAHFGEALLEPGRTVFEGLATVPATGAHGGYRDPAFDLQNPALTSFAANVLSLLSWRTYEDYARDMRETLGVAWEKG
jgi:hypothetical protein